MPAAFNPEVEHVDQNAGPNAAHTGNGSRFGPEDVRGPVVIGASVQQAVQEFKRGSFTVEDLKQLAFAMGCRVVEGRDAAAHAAQIDELTRANGELENRARMAEGALVGKHDIKPESIAGIAAAVGLVAIPADEHAALLAAQSELTDMKTAQSAAKNPQAAQ